MDDKEFMRRLSAIPQADRQRIDMTEAFRSDHGLQISLPQSLSFQPLAIAGQR